MRRLGFAIQALLGLILLLFVIDWGWMHIRIARSSFGPAFDTVQVAEYLTTPLKGDKMEYDYMGMHARTCSRSLVPQMGNNPCWWVRRHNKEWQ